MTYTDKWYDSFLQCEQENKDIIIRTYADICTGMNNRNIPLYANISKNNDGTFGQAKSNGDIVYCIWDVLVDNSSKKLSIYLSKSNESYESGDKYSLEIIHKDNRVNQLSLNSKSNYQFEEKGLRQIKFRYLGYNIKQQQPFILKVQYVFENDKINTVQIFIIIFILAVGIVVVGCIVFWVWEKVGGKKKINQSQIESQKNIRDNNYTNTIANLDSKKYVLVLFNKEMKSKGTNCTICLEKFIMGKYVLQLACGHFYHRKCIMKWIEQFSSSVQKCLNCNEEIKSFVNELQISEENNNHNNANNNLSKTKQCIDISYAKELIQNTSVNINGNSK